MNTSKIEYIEEEIKNESTIETERNIVNKYRFL